MIRTIAITKEHQLLHDVPIEGLSNPDIAWYWVDFSKPTEQETNLLDEHFHFHPLAIEDCIHFLQRPKIDAYEGYHFFVLHALNQLTLDSQEIDLFLGPNFLVSFHHMELREVEATWVRIKTDKKAQKRGPAFIAYAIMDQLVDNYFPTLYQIEEQLDNLEENTKGQSVRALMDQVFDIRSDLLKIRRTVVPMRDMLYRILNMEQRLHGLHEQRVYFTDVHDHLLRLNEMIDANREMTADMRDSYLSLNSNRMNTIMMTLTVITTIFMPLTLIAGVYGMNFEYMPELTWQYGYYFALGLMITVGSSMFFFFYRRGWFDK